MNREGKNGYFTLESKRRLKAEAQVSPSMGPDSILLSLLFFSSNCPEALKDEAAEEGSASLGKTDNKKRGHVKDDPDAEAAAEDEPPAKKTKARTKKEPKIKNEGADGGSENEGPTMKKDKTRTKKEPKIKNEDVETRSEIDEPTNKKTKAAIKKGKRAKNHEADEDFEQDAQPVQKGRKRAKKATTGDSDDDALPLSTVKKTRAPRKAATTKKVKDEDTESDGLDPASELDTPVSKVKLEHTSDFEAEAKQEVPKLQKGRKKATKKAANGTVEGTSKEMKPKVRIRIE